jgi:hypothetical protein
MIPNNKVLSLYRCYKYWFIVKEKQTKNEYKKPQYRKENENFVIKSEW